jgi:TFIIF-interacting CTD phosphatase-like protein
MDKLDPLRLVPYRLFRQHCSMANGGFVKDLTRLERNMKDMIILDVLIIKNRIVRPHML